MEKLTTANYNDFIGNYLNFNILGVLPAEVIMAMLAFGGGGMLKYNFPETRLQFVPDSNYKFKLMQKAPTPETLRKQLSWLKTQRTVIFVMDAAKMFVTENGKTVNDK